ncbi:MAG: nitroreductase [Allosphingosinicella sp.]
MTTVTEAVLARYSVRSFLERPVDRSTIEDILEAAKRAPSGGNLQPWSVDVLAGAPLAELKGRVRQRLRDGLNPEATEFPVYPPALQSPWRDRRFAVGEQLYRAIGIPREDRPARLRQFAHNYDFFGAPVGLFFSIERSFGLPQWAHLGMFIQTVMLLALERGLGACAQEAWAVVHETVGDFLGLPPGRMLYCGMALGWPDEAAPINGWRSEREPLESFVAFHGF